MATFSLARVAAKWFFNYHLDRARQNEGLQEYKAAKIFIAHTGLEALPKTLG